MSGSQTATQSGVSHLGPAELQSEGNGTILKKDGLYEQGE